MIHFLGIIFALVVYGLYRRYKSEKERESPYEGNQEKQSKNEIRTQVDMNEETMKQQQNQEILQLEKQKTRELAFQILREMGCQPEETEEGRIRFDYQGITFLMEAVDECVFVNLIWPWCYSFNIFDVDEYARVRKVVNEINIHNTATFFYIPNLESDEVAIHVKKNFLFIKQIPQLGQYLHGVINGFFRATREFEMEVEKKRLQESEK